MRALAALLLCTSIRAFATDHVELRVPQTQTAQERATIDLLVEESTKRGRIDWHRATAVSGAAALNGLTLIVAKQPEVEPLLPPELRSAWHAHLEALHPIGKPEGFSIITLPWQGGTVRVLAGNDQRGELFAVGWLLRHASFSEGDLHLPLVEDLYTEPDKPVRGHQIGYRAKNNTYDAWTLPQFEQQIRDLAIFGANTIQIIAPASDDAPTSPLMPAPPLETYIGISKLADKYGLDCDLYYPEMGKDYRDPAQFQAELTAFEALARALPRVDALYVPGGDPGHTAPDALFPLVEAESRILRRIHPGATTWISAQGFNAEQYERFYARLGQHPDWLTGVFFGPQSRDSIETQRKRIPEQFQLRFYPDIAHTMHAQFPIPEWDPIFALTEGREPIDPRPEAFTDLYRHYAQLHTGFITYSEGVNDDLNKMLWSQLGWSAKTPVESFLKEYSNWFLRQDERAAEAIEGLERNWRGPLATNPSIPRTLALFKRLEKTEGAGNWRWQALLYRATYDAYLQLRFKREQATQHMALVALGTSGSSHDRVARAARILAGAEPTEEERHDHDELFRLAGDLFKYVGLQLSVARYGASNWERGANLDRVDTPLNDAAWLRQAMERALGQPTERARVDALDKVAHWEHPVPGALYDDLGNPAAEPHLVRGEGWQEDPELFHAAIDGIADHTLADGWRLSQLTYAEALYEQPLTLHYDALDPALHYRLRITYAGEDYAVPLTLTANGMPLQSSFRRSTNPETVEVPLPQAKTLTLVWTRPPGGGGSGRGRQVAEIWLLPGQ